MNATASDPRQRLLDTAGRLFDAEGIHGVGVDRLVSEASVTRATFYRHFPTKERLVEAYLHATDDRLHASVERALGGRNPRAALEALLDLMDARTRAADFRGCQFINAAAEYPDPEHPIRVAIDGHRKWFRRVGAELARQLDHPDPVQAGEFLVLLHDGVLVSAALDDPDVARVAVRAAVVALLVVEPREGEVAP